MRDEWTQERDDKLRALWPDPSNSMTKIADEIGCTKGAVAGRRLRLNLPKRASPVGGLRRAVRVPAERRTATAKRASERTAAAAPKAVATPTPVPWRKPCPCSWVIGDPRDKGWRYCDAPTVPGKSYCAEHHARSIRPVRQDEAA